MISRQPFDLFSFDITAKEAIALQKQMASQVSLQTEEIQVRYIAGVDVGFEEDGKVTRAVIAVLDAVTLQLVTSSLAKLPTSFPYVPGLLSFRELPAVLKAYEQLEITPDVLLCDGQGIAHPRRFGIASHLGVLIDKPTIGIGKTRLIGHYQEPSNSKGEWEPLLHKGERIGTVLRTRMNCKPLFVSPGHQVDHQQSIDLCLQATTRFKLPETTRHAHHIASNLK